MKSFLLMAAVAVCLVVCRPSDAETRIVLANDPAGPDVRLIARNFFLRIANGDEKGAKELFDGPAEQAQLLSAYLRLAQAAIHFEKAIATRFPSAGPNERFQPTALLRSAAEGVIKRPLILSNDLESIAATSLFPENGVFLRKVNGRWLVSALTTRRSDTLIACDFFLHIASATERVAVKVDAGKTDSPADAEALIGIEQRGDPAKLLRSAPTALALSTRAATRPSQSIQDLLALLGKHIRSDEIKKLIASLPPVPHMTLSRATIYLHSDEAGITANFELPAGTLRAISVYAEGAQGFDQYTGVLPEGLSFGMTRADAERKLGSPAKVHFLKDFGIDTDYPTLGLHLNYAGDSRRSKTGKIQFVALDRPDTKGEPPRLGHYVPGSLVFRLVVWRPDLDNKPVDLLPDPDAPTGAPVSIEKEVLLDETLFEDANMGSDAKKPEIYLRLTEAGGHRMEQISSANKGRALALILNGRIVTLANINGVMARDLRLTRQNATEQATSQLIDELQAVIDSVP